MSMQVNGRMRRQSADSDSSSPLRASYADIVKRMSPVSNNPTLVSEVNTQSHQDPPLPLPKRSILECSVCGRTRASKCSLHLQWRNKHRFSRNCP